MQAIFHNYALLKRFQQMTFNWQFWIYTLFSNRQKGISFITIDLLVSGDQGQMELLLDEVKSQSATHQDSGSTKQCNSCHLVCVPKRLIGWLNEQNEGLSNDCDLADGNDENENEENAGLVQVKISRSFPALSFPPGHNTRGLDNKNSNNNTRKPA